MEYFEYLEYLETCWAYFPYVLYTYVCLTFLPKTFRKIITFAKADYAANCNKYHRCYAPDDCCHKHITKPQKTRKAVNRVFPKKKATPTTPEPTQPMAAIAIKRQVSTIQTQTNVNQIAKMFESGGSTTHVSKQINWVTPTISNEIRTQNTDDNDNELLAVTNHEENIKDSNAKHSSRLAQLLQENIENSVHLLNQSTEATKEFYNGHDDDDDDNDDDGSSSSWRSEPIVIQRRSRPTMLNYADSSASTSPMRSPLLRFNLKTSLEDIFAAIARNAEQHENFIYAGCNALSPVTSIEDILAERRLSRPLSAYSISDLLNDNEHNAGVEEAYVESFLRKLNKT